MDEQHTRTHTSKCTSSHSEAYTRTRTHTYTCQYSPHMCIHIHTLTHPLKYVHQTLTHQHTHMRTQTHTFSSPLTHTHTCTLRRRMSATTRKWPTNPSACMTCDATTILRILRSLWCIIATQPFSVCSSVSVCILCRRVCACEVGACLVVYVCVYECSIEWGYVCVCVCWSVLFGGWVKGGTPHR